LKIFVYQDICRLPHENTPEQCAREYTPDPLLNQGRFALYRSMGGS
jgi:hypothetical protein